MTNASVSADYAVLLFILFGVILSRHPKQRIGVFMINLQEALNRLPRLRLAQLPTPLQFAPRLSKALGGPAIYFKRDDLTGMPLGGNKTRMFEYVLPRALASGADCVIAGAAIQSNYCRQLTAACAQVGLEVYLVLRSVRPDVEEIPQGNFLLDLLMGAHIYIVENMGWPEQIEKMYEMAEQLRAQGRKPYVARAANQADIGLDTAAYTNCALELHQQLVEQEIKPDYLYVAAADTTQGGLLLGAKILGESYQIVGINPLGQAAFGGPPASELIRQTAHKAAAELGLLVEIRPEEIISSNDYVGEGYAIPTPAGLAAIRLVASTEGILLDPVYTGKAMAGLIDHIKQGLVKANDTVIFLHTGGYPALFAYQHYFDFEDQIVRGAFAGDRGAGNK
jgi:1-aminocyclopropane-1-carboxylate deaminase/D-cysteine desulfhydrase-like pyridoxal-dependent ACC family enzyme